MRFVLREVNPGENQRRILGAKDHYVIEAEWTNKDGAKVLTHITRCMTLTEVEDFSIAENITIEVP